MPDSARTMLSRMRMIYARYVGAIIEFRFRKKEQNVWNALLIRE